MNFNPLVSIVIPVYNGSDYMKEAIDSALNQTYNNCEVIVVNDGSNDERKTEVIAKSYGDKIRYFFKENGGVSSALNLGIQKMNGEYFSWLSHDDVYVKDKLEIQIETLRKMIDKNTIFFSEYYMIDNNSRIIGKSNINFFDYEFLDLYIIFKRPLINGNTLLIPKIVFNEVGLFNNDLKYTQDYDMWFRVVKKFKFFFIKKELIKSRIHNNQGSRINPNFKSYSLELKNKQLSLISNQALLKFTRSKSLIMSYLKLLLFSYFQGGEENEYPMKIWINNLSKIKTNKHNKLLIILIVNAINKTLIFPNRLRRSIVRAIFSLSNSSFKDMFLNEK